MVTVHDGPPVARTYCIYKEHNTEHNKRYVYHPAVLIITKNDLNIPNN
jgi:hypothetical protein